MITIREPDFEFEDDRGKLTQLVREGFSQVNVVRSKAGTVRGGHCHRLNKEAFYIIEGRVEVALRRDGEAQTHTFGPGAMFVIDECVFHDFRFTDDTLLVGLYSRGVETGDGKMDIIPEEE